MELPESRQARAEGDATTRLGMMAQPLPYDMGNAEMGWHQCTKC
jgi:hypothetical protein